MHKLDLMCKPGPGSSFSASSQGFAAAGAGCIPPGLSPRRLLSWGWILGGLISLLNPFLLLSHRKALGKGPGGASGPPAPWLRLSCPPTLQ